MRCHGRLKLGLLRGAAGKGRSLAVGSSVESGGSTRSAQRVACRHGALCPTAASPHLCVANTLTTAQRVGRETQRIGHESKCRSRPERRSKADHPEPAQSARCRNNHTPASMCLSSAWGDEAERASTLATGNAWAHATACPHTLAFQTIPHDTNSTWTQAMMHAPHLKTTPATTLAGAPVVRICSASWCLGERGVLGSRT